MNIRNHPNWTVRHEARLQTLLAFEGLLNELRTTEPDQKSTFDAIDILNSKRSAEDVLDSLLRINPSERAITTAQAMWERH